MLYFRLDRYVRLDYEVAWEENDRSMSVPIDKNILCKSCFKRQIRRIYVTSLLPITEFQVNISLNDSDKSSPECSICDDVIYLQY